MYNYHFLYRQASSNSRCCGCFCPKFCCQRSYDLSKEWPVCCAQWSNSLCSLRPSRGLRRYAKFMKGSRPKTKRSQWDFASRLASPLGMVLYGDISRQKKLAGISFHYIYVSVNSPRTVELYNSNYYRLATVRRS